MSSDKCSTESDFIEFSYDFTDEKEIERLLDEDKLVILYRRQNNGSYSKDCFIREQLLSALTVETANQITLWGTGSWEQRVKKLGHIPAIGERFNAEYISERSIRFLNIFNIFEIVDCGQLRVGSQSAGVGILHGSNEIVCRLSPLKKITDENIINNIDINNKKFVNINGTWYERLITVFDNFRFLDTSGWSVFSQIKDGKLNGYGELIKGYNVSTNILSDILSDRLEIHGFFQNNNANNANYNFSRAGNKLSIILSYVEDNITKTNIKLDTTFNEIRSMRTNQIAFFPLNIKIDTSSTNTNIENIKLPVFRNNMIDVFEITNYIAESHAKIALLIYLISSDIEDEYKYSMIQLLLNDNYNTEEIIKVLEAIKNINFLENNVRSKFIDPRLIKMFERYSYIIVDNYTDSINDIFQYIPPRQLDFTDSDADTDEEDTYQALPVIATIPIPQLPAADTYVAREFRLNPDQIIEQMEEVEDEVMEPGEYFENLYEAIEDGDSREFAYDYNKIPLDLRREVLDFDGHFENVPLIFRALEFHTPTILEFLLQNGAKANIDYRLDGEYYNNPLSYYFKNNYYMDEDQTDVENILKTFFRNINNPSDYINSYNLLTLNPQYQLPRYIIDLLTSIRDNNRVL